MRPDQTARIDRHRLARLCAVLIAFLPITLHAEYPEIRTLTNDDGLYRQLQSEIESYYRLSKSDRTYEPTLTFFTYRPTGPTDLYAISARTNIPYDTLVTSNRARSVADFNAMKQIVIPSIPGLFVPDLPTSDLEEIMCSGRDGNDKSGVRVIVREGNKKTPMTYYHGARFTAVERAFFLGIFFMYPIPRGRITSHFGRRRNPFSGHPEVHNGIDLAADKGTDVFAVREGTVEKTGADETYGRYVLITHPGNYQSFYGHLDRILVEKSQTVRSGTVIGKVGTTGKSTGPHLHFEIRKKGTPIDPTKLIKAP